MDAPAKASATRGDRESAWELAKTRFLDDLEPDERQLFQHATLENLYYSTSNINRIDAESSRTRAIAAKLEPLVAAITAYGPALDNFTQIAPLYIAPIWGCVRVLLVAAEAHSKFYTKIVDCLARVGDILPRFRDYERIYDLQKHARLTQVLSNTYLDLIVICTEFRAIIRDHRASKFRRILKPLSISHKFDDAIEKFRRHRKEVEKEAATCHMIEAAEQRDNRLMLAAAQRRQKLLSRLSSVDCARRHAKLQSMRHEGTGAWLSEHEAYVKWTTSIMSPAVLCCHGILIDSLKKNIPIAFYYCDYADKRTIIPANIFATLARQVLEYSDGIPDSLADTIEHADHDGDHLTDAAQALHVLQESLAASSQVPYLIVDGLDECTESSQKIVWDGLQCLLSREKSSINIFITARSDVNTLLKLNSFVRKSSIFISPSTIALDIEAYVRDSTRHRLSNGSLVLQDPNLQDLIVQKLVNGAQGMFLWVEFQLNDLCAAETDRGIKSVLDNLPQSLSETYDRLLTRIEGAERAILIERMFKWLVCALQPLHVNELREGLAFTLQDSEWDRDKIITDLNRLVRACSNLVFVDPETQIVQLAHYTVEQYLLQDQSRRHISPQYGTLDRIGDQKLIRDTPFTHSTQDEDRHYTSQEYHKPEEQFGGNSTRFRFTRKEADIMLGEFCIAYLSFSDFETRLTTYKENAVTDMVMLERLATHKSLLSPDHSGRIAVKIWNNLKTSDTSPVAINMVKFATARAKAQNLSQYECLPYVMKNWLRHSASFPTDPDRTKDIHSLRRENLFRDLVLGEKKLPFHTQPWIPFLPKDKGPMITALLGWGLMENHKGFILIARQLDQCGDTVEFLSPGLGWRYLHQNLNNSWEQLCRRSDSRTDFPKHELEFVSQDTYAYDNRNGFWLFSKLLIACHRGHVEAIKSCKLMPDNGIIRLCIVIAAINSQLPLLEMLLARCDIKPPPSIKVEHAGLFLNALEHAMLTKRSDIVQILLDSGLSVELFSGLKTQDQEIEIPLFSSLHLPLPLPLPLPAGNSFFVLLEEAVDGSNLDCVHALLLILLETPAISMNEKREIWEHERVLDALSRACHDGHDEIAEVMLRHGVNPNRATITTTSPLFNSIAMSHITIVKLLLKYGASTEFTDMQTTAFAHHGFPVTYAASIGDVGLVKLLLDDFEHRCGYSDGGDMFALSKRDHNGTYKQNHNPQMLLCPTPLYVASYCGNLDVVKFLLGRGYRWNIISPTHFIYMSRRANGDILCSARPCHFLGKTRNYNLASDRESWKTPLQAATTNGHHDVVRALVERRVHESHPSGQAVVPRLRRKKSILREPVSFLESTMLHILDSNSLDTTTDLELLVAAGCDPFTVYIDKQTIFAWTLDNKVVRLYKAIHRKIPDDIELLFRATSDFGTQNPLERKRMIFVLSCMTLLAPPMDYETIDTQILPRLGVKKESQKWKDGLFNVFLFIISEREVSQDSLRFVNSIILDMWAGQTAQGEARPVLSGEEMSAIKAAYHNIDDEENVASLQALLKALYAHHNNHRNKALCNAIKHRRYQLVQIFYNRWPVDYFRGAEIPLILAVETEAPINVLTMILKGESKKLTCCLKNEEGKTALDIAVELNYVQAIELLQSDAHACQRKPSDAYGYLYRKGLDHEWRE